VTAEVLPLFPLNTVLYPGIPLPLHVFEPRYRRLVADLLDGTGPRRFGVVAIRRGLEVGEHERPELHDIGCVADVRRVDRFDDGRYDLLTVGGPRFRLVDVDETLPYLRATVGYLPDVAGDGAGARMTAVVQAFDDYAEAIASSSRAELPEDDPVLASYVVAASLRLDLPDKQELLALPDASARLRRELSLLRRETALALAAPAEVPSEGPFSLT
jgi:Lon protease-like protein